MKKKFVFDSMEYDFSDIDEQTIIKDTGVDTEKVKTKVMTEIKNRKKPRQFNKKVVWGLVAAAAVLAAMGTITVGAIGGFNQVFGDWFAGNPKYGLFAGDNVSYTSDQVDIGFQGIAGDDNFVGAAMTIRNKDGSPFIEDTKGEFLLYGANDIDVSLSPIGRMFYHNAGRGGTVCYSLEDKGTIKATAFYEDESKHLKGERMTIKEQTLTAFRLDEVIGDVSDDYDELVNKYKDKLGKDQSIYQYSSNGTYEDNKYYIVTEFEIPLNFELSVTLNYKTVSRNIDIAQGKDLAMNGMELAIDSLDAKSFGININATVGALAFPKEPDYANMNDLEAAAASYDYMREIDSHGFMIELTITMKDGSRLKAAADSRLIGVNSETSTTGTIYSPYLQGGAYTAINPDEIDFITAEAKPLTSE